MEHDVDLRGSHGWQGSACAVAAPPRLGCGMGRNPLQLLAGEPEPRCPTAGVVTQHLRRWPLGAPHHRRTPSRCSSAQGCSRSAVGPWMCAREASRLQQAGWEHVRCRGGLLEGTGSILQPCGHTTRGRVAQPDQGWPCALTYAVAIPLHEKVLRLMLLSTLRRWA